MERRRIARVNCACPLTIIEIGSVRADRREITRNISANGGICFFSAAPLEVGVPVQYEIVVSRMNPPVRLRCGGRVVRCQPAPAGAPDGEFEIAITMERYRFAHSDTQVIGNAVDTRTAPADAQPVRPTRPSSTHPSSTEASSTEASSTKPSSTHPGSG